ncbi:hypothetical protein [Chitinophaga nivalis]|uniref:Anti-sigma factor n=1 Tax=Chitinophaga nivalis TaxID=2991709 RepID=A0ABT3IWG8_9BACT|nr:hypothetical protein [Chitinophaga nivalis]MCW3462258.1 hypothetical protein [Chitinophaga nivalis]MCW3488050.1 hypothetical protein [Chitinophaga nivalis]
MELKFYIESGIIEAFVMGLATEDEVEELRHMRKLYPELDTEVALVERRLEKAVFDEPAMPPVEVRERVLQQIRWEQGGGGAGAATPPNYTFINLQPNDGNHITVHRWWKIFFIIFFIMSKIFLFLAIFYYLKYRQEQERAKTTGCNEIIYQQPDSSGNTFLL